MKNQTSSIRSTLLFMLLMVASPGRVLGYDLARLKQLLPHHPATFIETRAFSKALWQHRSQLKPSARLLSLLVSSSMSAPIRALEQRVYAKAVSETKLTDLTMIVGHWRSGTTLLHNLLSSTNHWGYISTWQNHSRSSIWLVSWRPLPGQLTIWHSTCLALKKTLSRY